MISRLGFRCGLLWVLAFGGSPAAFATPLDDYVYAPDPSYRWEIKAVHDHEGYTDYIVYFASQRWLTTAEVDRTLWEHWLIITKPDNIQHQTGLLFIAGGGNSSQVPTGNPDLLVQLALQSRSAVAYLRNVPNQPLTFTGYRPETEDGLIAYGWARFFESGDPKWLMRLPMTKAAVRAMDTFTEVMAAPEGGGLTVDKFVVTGASKRGWTAWTTAAVEAARDDNRVVAFAPIVIDLLNMEVSFRHHWDSLGQWSPQIWDYVVNGITDWFGTSQMRSLCEIVEPYWFRERFGVDYRPGRPDGIPKFIVNASGDSFFLPDSSQFYYDRLPGRKHLYYVANSDHGGVEERFALPLSAWYWSILNDAALPEVTWYKRHDGSLVIDTHGTTPSEALLWKASNPNERIFMQAVIGDAYTSSRLDPVSPATPDRFVASVPAPAQGWTAFFVEFKFNIGGPIPFSTTTEVSIVPDVLPYGPRYTLGSPTDLLDAGFYTEGATVPSPVRDAVGGVASNDGKRVAFWGVHKQTQAAGLFVVNVGRPSSWRRIVSDLPSMPTSPIVWLPDDSGVVVGQMSALIPEPGRLSSFHPYVLHSWPADIRGMTAKASGNWAVAIDEGQILALPILPNGTEDFTRRPVFVTDLGGSNIRIVDVAIAADGSVLAFSDSRPGAGQADFGDVYAVRNLPAVLAANLREGTDTSSLAPASLDDDNLFRIRTAESDNFAGFPSLSDDGSLVYFVEDWANRFQRGNPIASLAGTDFDLMVSYGDGTEADQRLVKASTQGFLAPTRGGTRVVCSESVSNAMRLRAMPLRTSTKVSGLGFEAKSTYVKMRQQFESDGSASVDVDSGVTIDIPEGQGDSIWIETPVAPVEYASIPAGTAALPVVRRIGPEGTTFTKPAGAADAVLLRLNYTDAEVHGLDENQLRVYRFDGAMFRQLDPSRVTVDKVRNEITARIDALGTYAVGGPGAQDDDGDGMGNRYEAHYGLDPYSPHDFDQDSDGDGLTNLDEWRLGTSPVSEDSDGDGVWDSVEVRAGSNPVDGQSVPPLPVRGDVDWSGVTNAIDVQLVINGALGKATSCRTDVNGDNRTDAFDVQVVINAALGIL